MSTLEVIVIIAGAVAAVGAVAWFIGTRHHPERAADTRAGGPEDVARRPAGPGAEQMSSDRPGGRSVLAPDAAETDPETGVTDPPGRRGPPDPRDTG